MAPVTPHWQQPSHPEIQNVIVNDAEYTTKSYSKVALPPFAVYAKLAFPPCTMASEPTYATVQMGKNSHLSLNSDLLYINHSCEPSLIFDTGNFNILAGPKGLQPGDELTFFYPCTEWDMSQSFDCLCGTPTCRGKISGAKNMMPSQLEGIWLNGHIRQLLDEKSRNGSNGDQSLAENGSDPTAKALRDTLGHAEQMVDAARLALRTYVEGAYKGGQLQNGNAAKVGGEKATNGALSTAEGSSRHGPSSRELSGEMSGDTVTV